MGGSRVTAREIDTRHVSTLREAKDYQTKTRCRPDSLNSSPHLSSPLAHSTMKYNTARRIASSALISSNRSCLSFSRCSSDSRSSCVLAGGLSRILGRRRRDSIGR